MGASVYDNYRSGFSVVKDLRSKVSQKEAEGRSRILSRTVVGQKRKRNKMSNGVYSMYRRKVRDGKYLSKQLRLNHIVSNSADTVKEVWSKVSDPADASGSNRGAYWLDNGPTANGVTVVPITVLDTVTQTASVVTPKNLPVYVFDRGV